MATKKNVKNKTINKKNTFIVTRERDEKRTLTKTVEISKAKEINEISNNEIVKEVMSDIIDDRYDIKTLYNIDDLSKLKSINDSNTSLTVGMIGNSHEFPVSECIFPERLTDEQILDFDYQYMVIDKFFKSKHNNRIKELNIYTSGLQSVLCSIVNYCQRHRIVLNAYHYNQSTPGRYTYTKQPVLTYSNRNKKHLGREYVKSVADHFKFIYTYDVELNDLKENDNVYVLKINHFSSVHEGRKIYDSCVISCNLETLMLLYAKILKCKIVDNDAKGISMMIDSYTMVKEQNSLKLSDDSQRIASSFYNK